MSETYFSKLDSKEKISRLVQLANSRGLITMWVKGQKQKFIFKVLEFDKERLEIILDTKENPFPKGLSILFSFELRGMFFFSQATTNKSIVDHLILESKGELYKSEKRGSYRLLTYPIYEVYAEFDLGEAYEGGKVIDLKSRTNQTALFKNFLKLLEAKDESDNQNQTVKYRVQDLSTTGLSLHIGELEAQFFSKDFIYKSVKIEFPDQTIIIPEVKVVYIVDYIAGDKNLKKYKVGLHFPNMPAAIDDQLGGKINQLLREIDFNKDFENFTK
jgi:c-di-GMP-binding flagellar brake protein YcgR